MASVLRRIERNVEEEPGVGHLQKLLYSLSRMHRLAPLSDNESFRDYRKRRNIDKRMRKLVRGMRRK